MMKIIRLVLLFSTFCINVHCAEKFLKIVQGSLVGAAFGVAALEASSHYRPLKKYKRWAFPLGFMAGVATLFIAIRAKAAKNSSPEPLQDREGNFTEYGLKLLQTARHDDPLLSNNSIKTYIQGLQVPAVKILSDRGFTVDALEKSGISPLVATLYPLARWTNPLIERVAPATKQRATMSDLLGYFIRHNANLEVEFVPETDLYNQELHLLMPPVTPNLDLTKSIKVGDFLTRMRFEIDGSTNPPFLARCLAAGLKEKRDRLTAYEQGLQKQLDIQATSGPLPFDPRVSFFHKTSAEQRPYDLTQPD